MLPLSKAAVLLKPFSFTKPLWRVCWMHFKQDLNGAPWYWEFLYSYLAQLSLTEVLVIHPTYKSNWIEILKLSSHASKWKHVIGVFTFFLSFLICRTQTNGRLTILLAVSSGNRRHGSEVQSLLSCMACGTISQLVQSNLKPEPEWSHPCSCPWPHAPLCARLKTRNMRAEYAQLDHLAENQFC